MNKKLLTLDDLYRFYSNKKKSMKFNAEKEGYNLAVQVKGRFEVIDENEEGLMFCRVKAFHDLGNLNKSYIDTDVLKTKMYSINNRPILADIIEVEDEDGNIVKDFNGHSMHINEDEDKIEYVEFPVGHFVNPENIELAYDEEHDRHFVYCDAVIYEEYTDTCDILRRRGGTDVSVELAIRDLAFDCKNKVLKLNDFYVQGCTLLGEHVRPGMAGSKLSLKDFAESNNSIFSDMTEEEHSKLIDTLERLNTTLSKFNNIDDATASTKDYGKEENNNVEDKKLVNEEVAEVEKTQETTVTETESTEETTVVNEAEEAETVEENPEVVEVEEAEVVETDAKKKRCEEESVEVTEENANINDAGEAETFEETKEVEKFSKTFELSHEDIRCALYELLMPYEEADNDYYWIVEVYDDHFVYEGYMGNYWGQRYTKNGDTIAFEGERYELYLEFLTSSQKAELDRMRSNYSSIEAELNKYKEAELDAQRKAIFNDESYSDFVETESFKKIKENINTYSVEELRTACDLAFAKEIKSKGIFSLNIEKKDEKKKSPSFFAFAKQETDSSFLDSLLKK